MSDETKMTKAERLALAGQVAPTLRSQSERARRRVVKVYNQETGEIVRHATLADVQRGILETAKIELDVTDGARATHKICDVCGRAFRVGKRGQHQRFCGKCVAPATCIDCGKVCGVGTMKVRALRGLTRTDVRCATCARCHRIRSPRVVAARKAEAAKRAAATHCARGHVFDDENTKISVTSGRRQCRACAREWSRNRNRKRRAQARKGRRK